MIQNATISAKQRLEDYRASSSCRPLFFCGDSLTVLREIPSGSIDCCMTSPPYWGHRQYAFAGIGLEDDFHEYIASLAAIFAQVMRVLKDSGSFWLNIGDSYHGKQLMGIPWRVALHLVDHQGWLLRNDVIWNKVKGGPDNAIDKLRNVHEHVFHFVKQRSYFYDCLGSP